MLKHFIGEIIIILITLTSLNTLQAQNSGKTSLDKRINEIEDKLAIKKVVDAFSILADTKDIDQQVLLFTEDGIVETFTLGRPSSHIIGRQQLKEVFSNFLSNFHIVYHQNGQHYIDDITDSTALATSYCRVVLVSEDEGKDRKTTLHTIYKDEFVKQNDRWYIKKRQSNFVIREVEDIY